VGRERAHEAIGEHALAVALAMREQGAERNDLLDRLAADQRLGLSREELTLRSPRRSASPAPRWTRSTPSSAGWPASWTSIPTRRRTGRARSSDARLGRPDVAGCQDEHVTLDLPWREPRLLRQGRDLYDLPDGTLLMVASDRISAFDVVLEPGVPDKGAVLTQLSLWWFDQMSDLVAHHVVSTDVPAPVRGRALVCERLEMFPVECVRAATSPAPPARLPA
jgi:hypothetical protein